MSKNLIFNASVLGAILSMSTTELRFNSFFGFGELLMIISIVFFLFNLKNKNFSNINIQTPYIFVICFFGLNFLGFIYALFFVREIHSDLFYEGAIRTFVAYSLSILNAFVLFLTVEKNEIDKVLRNILVYFNIVYLLTFTTLYTLLLLSISDGERFFGYSTNPNQHGILLVAIPFLAIYLFKNKVIKSWFFVLSIITSSLLAFLIISDSVYYSIIINLFFYFILIFKKSKIEINFFMILFLFFIFYFLIFDSLMLYIDDTNSNADQASVRFVLWKNGMLAFLESPLIGFGPGAFSGDMHPFELTESHNTFIDLLTNIGLLGLFFYLYLYFKIIKSLFIKNLILPLLMLSSVIVFSFFHNILRHPTFWLILFSLYYISQNGISNKSILKK